MKPADAHSRSATWLLRVLVGAMLLLILYSGLHFKDAAITNDVSRIDNAPGLRFSRSGIAYADSAATAPDPPAARGPLSIELALKPGTSGNAHFRFLVLLHGGNDADQLVIGQWRSWLIAMNGDDYDATRRQPRIAADVLHPDKERFVTVVSGENGTALFVDGQLVRRKPDMTLKTPGGKRQRLVLGNSIYGRHAWAGELYGLACYPQALTADTIARHYEQWRRDRSFDFARSEATSGLYLFEGPLDGRMRDHSGGGRHLRVPQRMTILSKEFLTAPFVNEGNPSSLFQDMAINLVGFVPMGLLLSALWRRARGWAFRPRLGMVLLTCGAISLSIELAQAFIPSRSSQMLDLILNTLGAGAGVLLDDLYRFARRAKPSAAPPRT